MSARTDWGHVLERAAGIVREYDTPVTLRQLFYRLVAAQLVLNTESAYKTLSDRTAKARRDGVFPDLADPGRSIHQASSWTSPQHALANLALQYRRDRTAGQDVSVYIGVEKKGLVAQLDSWFGGLGIPIIALGGYSSQSYVDQVQHHVGRNGGRPPLPEDRLPAVKAAVEEGRLSTRSALSLVCGDPRPAVLLYAGDFDPSGEDIDRDFVDRTDCWDKVVRVALTSEQVTTYDLPPAMGKSTDSRASQFIARHGRLVQVELDALAPPDLRALYQEAIDQFWDTSAYDEATARERAEREVLVRLADTDIDTIEAWLDETD